MLGEANNSRFLTIFRLVLIFWSRRVVLIFPRWRPLLTNFLPETGKVGQGSRILAGRCPEGSWGVWICFCGPLARITTIYKSFKKISVF